MNAATLKASILQIASVITTWCIWFGKLVVAIGIAYAAARIFSLGWFSIESIRIPYPKVTAEPLALIYLAGAIYLVK